MYREYRIPALAAVPALIILLALGLCLSPAHARPAPAAGAGVGDFNGDGPPGLVPAPSTSTATPIVCNSGTPGPWVEASPNPIDLHLAGVTNDGTYAYAAGGYSYSAGGYINHFTRYDPVANAWATLSPMPDANGQSGTVYSPINNKVYVFGGATGASPSVNNTRIYDVAAGTWAAGPPMPDVRANFAAAVYNPANNKIYLVGGTSGSAPASVQAQVWEYDPLAGTFTTTRRPIPQALGGSGYGVYNGHIYVAAGFDATATVSALTFDYNIAADTWTAKADMPTPVADPGSSIVNGKLWVYGGETSLTQAHAVINAPACPQAGGTMIYDLAADTWSNGPPFYISRSLTSGTTVGDYTVVVGGYICNQDTASTEVSINPAVSCSTATATPQTGTPTATVPPSSTVTPNTGTQTAVAGTQTAVAGTQTAVAGTQTAAAGTQTALASITAVAGTQTAVAGTQTAAAGTQTAVAGTQTALASITAQSSATLTAVAGTQTALASITAQSSATLTAVAGTQTAIAGTQTAAAGTQTAIAGTQTALASITAQTSATLTAVASTRTALACQLSFSDVHQSDYFYVPVQYLYCRGVISGYSDGTFRPYSYTTRAQMVKIAVLGFQKPIITPTGGGDTFTDVTPSNNFYAVIETAAADGIVSGYTCGTAPAGPCDSRNRPYFLPYNDVTRSQLSKIDVIAAGWTLSNPATPTFTDVPRGSTFYTVIETAVCHGVVGGYSDGTFRPYNNATRGQISKIVYLSIVNPPVSCP